MEHAHLCLYYTLTALKCWGKLYLFQRNYRESQGYESEILKNVKLFVFI